MTQFGKIEDIEDRLRLIEGYFLPWTLKEYILERVEAIRGMMKEQNPDFNLLTELCDCIIVHVGEYQERIKRKNKQ